MSCLLGVGTGDLCNCSGLGAKCCIGGRIGIPETDLAEGIVGGEDEVSDFTGML